MIGVEKLPTWIPIDIDAFLRAGQLNVVRRRRGPIIAAPATGKLCDCQSTRATNYRLGTDRCTCRVNHGDIQTTKVSRQPCIRTTIEVRHGFTRIIWRRADSNDKTTIVYAKVYRGDATRRRYTRLSIRTHKNYVPTTGTASLRPTARTLKYFTRYAHTRNKRETKKENTISKRSDRHRKRTFLKESLPKKPHLHTLYTATGRIIRAHRVSDSCERSRDVVEEKMTRRRNFSSLR